MERVRSVDGESRLVGGRCLSCGHVTFPHRHRCPACRAAETMDGTTLLPDGVVLSAVELHVSTDEWQAPYTLGLVRLADGVTLLARIDGADEAGTPVRLVVDDDDERFWFAAPAHAGAAPNPLSVESHPNGGDPP